MTTGSSPSPAALLALARATAAQGDRGEAGLQALHALRHAEREGDAATLGAARRLLVDLVPGYHTQVATDPARLARWEAALRSVVRPGMRALEIGTGCGILAMLAARAGARVTACERDPALAAIAEETVAANGMEGQVRILPRRAETLEIPRDLDTPAELLFLDVFADNLFAFRPFALLRQVRHLAAADALFMPTRVALVGALAHWPGWDRLVPDRAAGFDVSPLRAAAPTEVGIVAAPLLSEPVTLVEAELAGALPADEGEALHSLESQGGAVNGVLVWLRLELAPGHVLEARPGPQAFGFYARATFHPFAAERATEAGEQVPIRFAWRGRHAWAEPLDARDQPP